MSDHFKNVVDAIAATASLSPERVAICDGTTTMTYAEMMERASCVSLKLRRHGVLPGDCVTVALDHDIYMIPALLGVLRVGAIFVPIDVGHPPERTKAIVATCNAKACLASSNLFDGAQLFHADATILLDFNGHAPSDDSTPDPCDSAYILFTSGSTGKPKGVKIAHRSLYNYARWAANTYFKDGQHVTALHSPLTFDFTMTCIFPPLMAGSTIRVFHRSEQAFTMRDILKCPEVTVLKLTPAMLAVSNELPLYHDNLKRLIVGGEDLKAEIARQAANKSRGLLEIINEYGPTEATVGCMYHRFDSEAEVAPSVPLGKPIDNTGAVLIDQDNKIVAGAGEGELFVFGECLAEGYLGDAGATERAFREDVFGIKRLYKTGDLVYQDIDCNYFFRGRMDRQIKIRGHRIEFGDVESAALTHPLVYDCICFETKNSDFSELGMLAAVLSSIEKSELVEHLRTRLPQSMVPSRLDICFDLPRNQNGKVDLATVLGKFRS
ncbi:amino acid adenylation domain-containing protein [Salinarimonas sp.]|uniref:amino acid adenylation domain-containing protein n=1 Tax=Salinarimonas sp. TaxID=2766526 RepID=UPI00391B3AC8